MPEPIALIQNKIVNRQGLQKMLDQWQGKETVVFTNGCFDIVHRGHIDYLAKAAALGTRLVIGVNTDASTSRLKGPNRPIQDEYSRCLLLAALGFTDAVILFDEPTPYALIQLVQPDILVKGSDYKPEDIVGYDIVTAKGGAVKTIDYIPGFSTSAIEQKIKNS